MICAWCESLCILILSLIITLLEIGMMLCVTNLALYTFITIHARSMYIILATEYSPIMMYDKRSLVLIINFRRAQGLVFVISAKRK